MPVGGMAVAAVEGDPDVDPGADPGVEVPSREIHVTPEHEIRRGTHRTGAGQAEEVGDVEVEDPSEDNEVTREPPGPSTWAVQPLALRAQSEPCCILAISATMTVLDLKRRLRRALATAGAHPPQQPMARVRNSLSASRLRLYKRAGTRVGAVLRDEQQVGLRSLPAISTVGCEGRSVSFAGGSSGSTYTGGTENRDGLCGGLGTGWADAEIALQLLPADETLSVDCLVLISVTLDAAATPAATSTVAVPAAWSVTSLVDALACHVGIPRRQLAWAKVAHTAGISCGPLTPQQLGRLVWDDPNLLAAQKLSAAPLQLTDGDVLVLRDRNHPPPPQWPETQNGAGPRDLGGDGNPAPRRARVAMFRDEVGFVVS